MSNNLVHRPVAGPGGYPVITVADVSSLPGAKEPQASVGSDGRVYVAFGTQDAVYCAVSAKGGTSFGPPLRLPDAGRPAVGMRRGPRVAVAKGAVVVSAIYMKGQGAARGHGGGGQAGHVRPQHGPQDGDLLSFRSLDGGKTWKGPVTVSDVPGAAREGLHAMAAAPDGTLACTWLDLREKGTVLYACFSKDGGATWGKNVPVYRSPAGNICECCHPSVAYDSRGTLYLMWRNWLDGARDMYLAISRDGGRSFSKAQKLGVGTWPLNACPMDGGAVAISPSGGVTTFWRRQTEIFSCKPGEAEQGYGRGQQGWAAATKEGPYLVWIRERPGTVFASVPGQATPVEIAAEGNDPVVVAPISGNGPVLAAWTGKTGIEAALLRK